MQTITHPCQCPVYIDYDSNQIAVKLNNLTIQQYTNYKMQIKNTRKADYMLYPIAGFSSLSHKTGQKLS